MQAGGSTTARAAITTNQNALSLLAARKYSVEKPQQMFASVLRTACSWSSFDTPCARKIEIHSGSGIPVSQFNSRYSGVCTISDKPGRDKKGKNGTGAVSCASRTSTAGGGGRRAEGGA